MAALETLVVALIVAGCAIFSAWRLMSLRLRLRVIGLVEKIPGRIARGWAAQTRQRTLEQLSGGCNACSAGPNRKQTG